MRTKLFKATAFTGLMVASSVFANVATTPVASAATTNCMTTASAHASIVVSNLTATAKLTVPAACGNQQVTLVSYTAPSVNGQPYAEQKVYKSTTQTLTPGTYSLNVQVPDCFYQVDLVTGTPITDFSNTNYHAENRFLVAANAGDKVCETTPPVTTTTVTPVAPTTLPNTGPGNVIGLAVVTTIVGSVLHANRRKLQNLFARA